MRARSSVPRTGARPQAEMTVLAAKKPPTEVKSTQDYKEKILSDLEYCFKELVNITSNEDSWKKLTDDEKIIIEKNKLVIVQVINERIQKQYQLENQKIQKAKSENSFWRNALFYFLIIADVALMSIAGYLGSIDLIQFIPGIANFTAIIISGIATLIECVMMYSVFKPFLQDGLGITQIQQHDSLAKTYSQRLDLMNKMNSTMINNPRMTRSQGPGVYESYVSLLKLLNEDMRSAVLLPYEEPFFKKALRASLSGLSFLFSIASAYFSTIILIAALAPALIGTPVGWAIIGLFIVAQIVSKLVVRQSSVYSLLNPFIKQHAETENKLNTFRESTKSIDNDINADLSDLQHASKPALKSGQQSMDATKLKATSGSSTTVAVVSLAAAANQRQIGEPSGLMAAPASNVTDSKRINTVKAVTATQNPGTFYRKSSEEATETPTADLNFNNNSATPGSAVK